MGKKSIIAGVSATLGTLLTIAAQTKPEDAISNLGGWYKLATGSVVEAGLFSSPYIDTTATIFGSILIASAFFGLGLHRKFRLNNAETKENSSKIADYRQVHSGIGDNTMNF